MVRSIHVDGGEKEFTSLEKAIQYANSDHGVWKLSIHTPWGETIELTACPEGWILNKVIT